MSILWAILANPIGRVAFAFVLAIVGTTLSFTAGYWKGYLDGRSSYKAKIEREINTAVKKGNDAAARALREFDSAPDSLPNDGFRRD